MTTLTISRQMTNYDKACRILIDRCQKIVSRSTTELDSYFWQSTTGKLGVKSKYTNAMWYLCILNECKGCVTKQAVLMPGTSKHESYRSFSSQEALIVILDYAKVYDIYVGWEYMGKILSKNDTLENLLVEYDLKY